MSQLKFSAIVAAAGYGTRFGEAGGKQYLELDGMPILVHSLLTLERCPSVERVVIAVNSEDVEWISEELLPRFPLKKTITVSAGGSQRQYSVYNALKSLPRGVKRVVVHDGARPLATPELFERTMAALGDCDGVVPAVSCRDTVKEVNGDRVVKTYDRSRVRQAFRFEALRDAHTRASRENYLATDDAALLERYNYTIKVVEGERSNIKITFPEDLIIAQALLAGLKERSQH